MTDGVIVTFDTKRGFGFARVKGLRDDVFVHIGDVPGGFPLKAGQKLRFELVETDKGYRARSIIPGPVGVPPWMTSVFALGVALGMFGVLFYKIGLGPLGAGLAALNVITWFVYGWDKRSAGLAQRRVPEAVLLGFALLGGSVGAMLGMWAFRHKTRKRPFLVAFAAILLIQILLLYAWVYHG